MRGRFYCVDTLCNFVNGARLDTPHQLMSLPQLLVLVGRVGLV